MTGFKVPDDNDIMIRLDLPASLEFLKLIGPCIQALVEHVETLAGDQSTALAYNLELATYEACTNIVEHAYIGATGRIDLLFSLDQRQTSLAIGIRDSGKAFDFNAREITLPGAEQTSGFGLYLIRELVDEVHYSSSGGSNQWWLFKRL